MPRVTYTEHSGEKHLVEGRTGDSLMRIALDNNVPGIIGDCGGAAACATCHVYIQPDWLSRLPAPSRDEADMIECAIDPQPNSRLSCQVLLSVDLNGIEVILPETQL